MQLSAEQANEVRQWVAQGAGLSEIQKQMQARFGLALTYMDVRLLVIDLGLNVADKPGRAAQPAAQSAAPPADNADEGLEDAAEPAAASGMGQVSVQVDRIMKPGSLVSGKVTFADGVSATWMIDQMGRLGLAPEKRGYKPSQGDLASFQMELRKVLETHGY